MSIYNELKARSFVYQETDAENIAKILDNEKVAFYVGFDPTGSSLHVGHLLPIMAMRLLQRAGHIPIVLVGGATAQIGDPSGKQTARPILTKDEVGANAAALREQLGRFISIDSGAAHFVNNHDWFKDVLYIDFLREIGSKFSVNRMLAQESVKMRLETGLTFLEFNYSILQAYDFYILNRDLNCRMQFGGQDQWGNIVAGTELVRKMSQNEVFAMTFPLLTDSSGNKFGKTAGGTNIWLDKARTPVFDYYQFWRNCEDHDVRRLLCFFTNLPVVEIEQLAALTAPAINRTKEILAYEATRLAHGDTEAANAYLAAGTKFGFADPECIIPTSSAIKSVSRTSGACLDDFPSFEICSEMVGGDGLWVVQLFTNSGLCGSNSESRRLIQGGGAYLNDQRITDVNMKVALSDFNHNYLILKAGKKNILKVVLAS
jgi:tyrosyl-tRNA synthetase